MTDHPLVPADFAVPRTLVAEGFRLEPLGEQHNESDHAAWTSSIEYIRADAGFTGGWPPAGGMTPEQNLADLRRHAADFEQRRGFTYTVLEPDADVVVGCVYIYPDRADPSVTKVCSWVRADRAELDAVLRRTVSAWLAESWPLREVRYSPR
ncbi:N-acetyltransferase [Kitasatospora sp. CM 4170]|uniref:N-acetyltransferase n=1 Tax=Kitasatospora aburaviensis TaxID=67265 RepID=A0ABW1ETW6_9ACTN|nr:N-acetyltransferase [Kitasatospora sp. CM 4170]WNM44659.1 N-acetyltransferase [Kitasatospora sp. CM 4170]